MNRFQQQRMANVAPMDVDGNPSVNTQKSCWDVLDFPSTILVREVEMDEAPISLSLSRPVEPVKVPVQEPVEKLQPSKEKSNNANALPPLPTMRLSFISVMDWLPDLLNVSMIAFLIATYMVYLEYQVKHQALVSALLQKQSICSKQYVINRCSPDTRVPALEAQCAEWERCVALSLTISPWRVVAECMADVVEAFVGNISYKSIAFLLCLAYIASVGVWRHRARSHSPRKPVPKVRGRKNRVIDYDNSVE